MLADPMQTLNAAIQQILVMHNASKEQLVAGAFGMAVGVDGLVKVSQMHSLGVVVIMKTPTCIALALCHNVLSRDRETQMQPTKSAV